ncbi:hypothetical protein LEP1GSC148_3692 [Leptospira interrogans serovar Canicola str. LT1962]|nr:hypothetical protein LEP1GSC148_3692 [Leptospira interrogans serovar Canicola str. LT1962]
MPLFILLAIWNFSFATKFRSSSHKFSLIVDSITFFEGSSVIKNVIAPTFLGFWDRF